VQNNKITGVGGALVTLGDTEPENIGLSTNTGSITTNDTMLARARRFVDDTYMLAFYWGQYKANHPEEQRR
jgi:hypothetical protein